MIKGTLVQLRRLGLLLALLLPATTAAAADFPVTATHLYGETTIPAVPNRVVSIGYNDQDFLYALGIAPIGVREWWGQKPFATWPWAEPARAALGATPQVMAGELNLEWVAAQKPDLIVAVYSDIDKATYERLSVIAPVIAQPAGYDIWQAPWQEQLRLISIATTGDVGKADEVIAELDARTAAARESHPQLVGRTGLVADYRDGQFTLWSSDSAPNRFLASFGMAFPTGLDAMSDESGWIRLSPELIDRLEADVVVWPVDNPDVNDKQKTIEALPLYRSLKIATEGRSVWLDDISGVLASALWFQSPLSIGYVIDALPGKLTAAVDGDPATAVPKLP